MLISLFIGGCWVQNCYLFLCHIETLATVAKKICDKVMAMKLRIQGEYQEQRDSDRPSCYRWVSYCTKTQRTHIFCENTKDTDYFTKKHKEQMGWGTCLPQTHPILLIQPPEEVLMSSGCLIHRHRRLETCLCYLCRQSCQTDPHRPLL